MVYYTIRLLAVSRYVTTIFTEFGKFRYNSLIVGMYTSGYLLQVKSYELLSDIEGIKTHIDDILFLSK